MHVIIDRISDASISKRVHLQITTKRNMGLLGTNVLDWHYIVKLKISANARCQRLVLCTSQCQWCSIDYLGSVIDFLCRFGHLISWSLVAIQGLIVALCSTLELLYSLSLGDFLVSSSRSLSLSFCRSA